MCVQSVTAAEVAAAAGAAAVNWFLASSALFGQNKIAASGNATMPRSNALPQLHIAVAAASASADAAGCRL